MAAQKQTPTSRTPRPLLIIWLAICVLLIVINVVGALQQSGVNRGLADRDIYTLETNGP